MKSRNLFLILMSLLMVVACARVGEFKLPGVYRVDIQQGNVIEQEMIDKLKPGMDKTRVKFIMGTPAIIDPFHSERWEYLYTFSEGGRRREQIHITLFFDEEEKLAYLDGDVKSALRKPAEGIKQQSNTVDVPLEKSKKGFFSKLFGAIPFIGDNDNPVETENTESKE